MIQMPITIRISWCTALAASVVAACFALAACSGASTVPPTDSGVADDAAPVDGATVTDTSAPDGTSADAKPDSDPYVFSFSVTLNGVKVAIDRGQFGSDGGEIYLELHDGGDAACPSQNSPTPKHTLIVSGLQKTGTSTPVVTLVDFVGDVITTPKPTRTASAATANVVFSSGTRLDLDLTATFDADGSGAGQVVAGYCASLDAQK